MEYKDGTSVYTIDGKKAGSLRRVVIDPKTKEVTHIVIEKGLLFKDDKVVPVENVASTSEDKVSLTCSENELKEMSPLDIERYVPLDETNGGVQRFDPMAGGVYGNLPVPTRTIKEVKRTISDELIALKEGAPVISADDQHVGNIEHLFTEPQTGKITHFLISQGSLAKTRKSIPYEWVKMITDEEVDLTVDAKLLEGLPEVQG